MLRFLRDLFRPPPPLTRDEEAAQLVAFILRTHPEVMAQVPIKTLRAFRGAIWDLEGRYLRGDSG